MSTQPSCSSASTQAHTYSADGEYIATLTVSDGGKSATKSTSITVGSNPPPLACDNADNDTFATASTLALDTPCQGTIAESGDEDFFKVTVAEAGVLVMTLDPVPSTVRMNINLYNGDQVEIAETSFGNAGQALTLEKLVNAGTHYILLDGLGPDSSPDSYTLNVSFDTTDGNERNDAFSAATSLTLKDGAVTTSGTIRSSGDEDFFKVTVDKAGVLIMTLDPVPSSVRMNINLYNEQQVEIAETPFGNVGQVRTLSKEVTAGIYLCHPRRPRLRQRL